MSSLQVVQNPEEENIYPCIYTSVVRDAKRVGHRNPLELVREND